MKLELKAKHFEGTEFNDPEKFPIAIAYKELTGNEGCEGVDDFYEYESQVLYRHKPYNSWDFRLDKDIAFANGFDETVIRTIELIEV